MAEEHALTPSSRRTVGFVPRPYVIPAVLLLVTALTVVKPWEWYVPIAGVLTAVLGFLPPARTRVRIVRALGTGLLVAAALRHLLYVDEIWGGVLVALVTAVVLALVSDPERADALQPASLAFTVFLVGTVGLELRLFNTWPLSWLSVGVTVALFLLLARLREPRGTRWTYRSAGAVALVLGELFLALLFWPTAPAVGGALLALAVAAALTVAGETPGVRWSLVAFGALAAGLLFGSRWS